MTDVLLPGIAATTVATDRLTQCVLHPDDVDPAGAGEAVLFVHGNVSSSLFMAATNTSSSVGSNGSDPGAT